MSRHKKSRRVTDIMPIRKSDKKPDSNTSIPKKAGKKLTRYELDLQASEEKRKRKHKGLASGSRHSVAENKDNSQHITNQDPRLGSRKKIPLIVEYVNKSEQNKIIPSVEQKLTIPDPVLELEQLENNEILNQLLDDLDAGKKLNTKEQKFVDECLDRIAQLMHDLGIEDSDENENNEDDLYRTFEKININQFK